jgi:hypothetical protein
MDTQIIVALITGVTSLCGIVLTPLTIQVVIPRIIHRQARPPGTGSVWRWPTLLQAALGGIVGVIVGYGIITPVFSSPCPPFRPTSVRIVSPLPDSRVTRLITVQGTVCSIPRGKQLWVLLVPEGATAYYPQAGPVVMTGGGAWSASAYVGSDDADEVGKGFTVIAALADEQGDAALRAYFSQSGPEYHGLEPLPVGVQLISQVRVMRR